MPPPEAVLLCGVWPHERIACATLVQELAAAYHARGRDVAFLCDGYGVRDHLGPDAVCYAEFPADRPFDWRAGFARKHVHHSLSALLSADAARAGSLLGRVGVIHTHLHQLIHESDHPVESRGYGPVLSGHVDARAGRRPLLVRTRHEGVQVFLDPFMRLTGVDYVALGREAREAILCGAVDLAPLVAGHVRRNRDRFRDWAWPEEVVETALPRAAWLLDQLRRWRHEARHFDAVACLTGSDVDETRELLGCDDAPTLTHVYNGISFEPNDRARVDRLVYGYHHERGLRAFRGGAPAREPIPFAPEDRKVLFVGRAEPNKGAYELAASLRDLYRGGRRHVRGLFVGPFSDELRRSIESVDSAGAADYLLFAGLVVDVDILASLFSFADVVAIPSHQEPFCLVGLEAYRMGKPCVVTEGTGAAEVYLTHPARHGVTMALPVRRRNAGGIERYHGVGVDSLSGQIALLLDRPDVAGGLASAGASFVREHYTATRMGDTYLQLFDLLRAGGPACRLHD